ncbi:uncharacterized protein TNCV_4242991 [Trichonephila clavipes]|nr:uncharacterized protein TNCV_4242991 [Trichonephila clavipes]
MLTVRFRPLPGSRPSLPSSLKRQTASVTVCRVIQPIVLPFMNNIQGGVFQLDNAPTHTAVVTQCALQGFDMLLYSARSPDLSPVDPSIGLQTGRPGFDARCHQTPPSTLRALNQWVRSLVGLITSAGTGEYFPPLQSRCRNCGGGDRGRRHLSLRGTCRAKIVLHLYGAQTTGVPLAHAMNFVGLGCVRQVASDNNNNRIIH